MSRRSAANRPLLQLNADGELPEPVANGDEQAAGKQKQGKGSRKRKRPTESPISQEREAQLTNFLFGDLEPAALGSGKRRGAQLQKTAGADDDDDEEEEKRSSSVPLFMEDRVGDGSWSTLGDDGQADGDDDSEDEAAGRHGGAAWADPDDQRLEVNIAAVPRTRKLRKSHREQAVGAEDYQRRLRKLHRSLGPAAAAQDSESEEGAAEDQDLDLPDWARLPPEETADGAADSHPPADAGLAQLLQSNESLTASIGSSASSVMQGEILGMDGLEDNWAASAAAGSGKRGNRQQQFRGGKLPKGFLQINRLKDANLTEPSRKPLSSVRFHPNGQLLATAGHDQVVRLFQVDGQRNAKLQGIHVPNFPVFSAEFLPPAGGLPHSAGAASGMAAGEELLLSGRRPFFFSYNLVKGSVQQMSKLQGRTERSLEVMRVSPDGRLICFLGNDGYILLVDAFSKQLVGQMKQNGQVRDIAFSPDGSLVYSIGPNSEIYAWDLGERRCMGLWADHGSLKSSSLACAADGSLASGGHSGVVNLYEDPRLSLDTEVPELPVRKSFMSLKTPVAGLRFNPSSEILCMWSAARKDELSLVHTRSRTVFANWPTSQTPLHTVTTVDFSPGSGFLAVGNERGTCLLYRMSHFRQA